MKKRVVSWLLVVLMLTSVLPTSVLAEMVDAAASTAVEQPLTEDAAVPKEPEEQEGSKTPEAPETPEVPEDTENTENTEGTEKANKAERPAAEKSRMFR